MSKYDKLLQQHKTLKQAEQEKLILAKNGMAEIVAEEKRIEALYNNPSATLRDIDAAFMEATKLNRNEVAILLLATALQIARWVIVNQLTSISNAGNDNVTEEKLHKLQEKIFKHFDTEGILVDLPYRASFKHIITTDGVPYDATGSLNKEAIDKLIRKGASWPFDLTELINTEKISLFKGGNHRYSTLGHDPVLGLLFGTGNIMTNTISTAKKPFVILTNHVIYTTSFKDPRIGTFASTREMLKVTLERIQKEPNVLVASLIKQIIHIGTDLYTPCGIHFPGANLVLSTKTIDHITPYISTGDGIKAGISGAISALINSIVEAVHLMLIPVEQEISAELYAVKTKKIILLSNSMALAANLVVTSAEVVYSGNKVTALKNLDIGGLIVTMHRLITDLQFIKQVKESYLENMWLDTVVGEDYYFIKEAGK